MSYKRFTCRTEYESDGDRAIQLLISIGVHNGELHRVAQTLREGESPNEQWFKRT